MTRLESLIINITDICDMACPFCLRGDGWERKIDLSLIPKIFEGIDEIEAITISGGEPGCNIEAVNAIVDYLVKHKDTIDVKGFSIITNGKEYHQELVDAVKTMMFLYLEKDYGMIKTISGDCVKRYNASIEETLYMFGLSVSLDEFHESIPLENWFKYRLSGVYSSVKETDFSKGGVIARGRGGDIPGSIYRDYRKLYVEMDNDNITASEIYVTVEGKVYGDCDISYEMEECIEPYGDLNETSLVDIINENV